MRIPIILSIASALILFNAQAEARIWETDFEKAAATAKRTGKYILLDFSGSDWCGSCIALNKEVFKKRDFKKYAKAKLVCVLVDFPRNKSLAKDLESQNHKLAFKYGVREYPTIIILSPEGKPVAKTGYREGGAKAYINHLKTLIYRHKTN